MIRIDPSSLPPQFESRPAEDKWDAAWQKDGVTYSMTSRLDPVEMVRLVAAEITQPREGREHEENVAASQPGVFGVTQPANYSEARPVSMSE